MTRITIIGSHGLYGRYGGWDQIVIKLSQYLSSNNRLLVVNPKENNSKSNFPNVSIDYSRLSGFGLQGLILDFFAVLRNLRKTDTFLLLGSKGLPAALISKYIFKKKIVVNVGGVEWQRPQYSFLVKRYLKWCFHMSIMFANVCILDNEHYLSFLSPTLRSKRNIRIISYGGEIDYSLNNSDLLHKYSFLNCSYFLSISRSIEDNKLEELCQSFLRSSNHILVLVSNFSKTVYGRTIFQKYQSSPNIFMIDGLYDKPELDLIRRNCFCYIHTHTLCGSSPSLIEMIITKKPIISINVPQNRYTLKNQGLFFSTFDELGSTLLRDDLHSFACSDLLIHSYSWRSIVNDYEKCF